MSGASATMRSTSARVEPVGERADQPRAGAERGAARGLRGQLAHEPDRHHPQAAGGAARGEPVLEPRQPAQTPLEVGERRLHADHDVGGDRRRTLAGAEDAPPIEIDRAQLGVRAAEIDQQCRGAIASRLGALQALLARGEIAPEPFDHRLDARAGRRRAIEPHRRGSAPRPRATASCRRRGCRRRRAGSCRAPPRRTGRESRGSRARPGRRATTP